MSWNTSHHIPFLNDFGDTAARPLLVHLMDMSGGLDGVEEASPSSLKHEGTSACVLSLIRQV